MPEGLGGTVSKRLKKRTFVPFVPFVPFVSFVSFVSFVVIP